MSGPTVIPAERLSPEALLGVIDEFLTREGTDYGHTEYDIESKRAQLRRQIDRGEVVIVFDGETGTCNLVQRRDLEPGKGAE
jgi:uncharacterized protein YheU (UPF0270 family)